MAFSINARTLPSCHDYASAVEAFNRSPDWGRHSGRYYGEKRMTSRCDRDHMGVRIEPSSGDVIFRYHRTDVVTWHKNDTFTINPYQSMSTSAFIGAFTPTGVYAQMTYGAGAVMCFYTRDPETFNHLDERIFILSNRTTFKRDGSVWCVDETGHDGTEKIDYPRVASRKAASAALKKYDFHGFIATLAPMLDILKPKSVRVGLHGEKYSRLEEVAMSLNDTRFGRDRVLEALKDRTLWPAFLMARALKPAHEPHKTFYGRNMSYTRKRHIAQIERAVRAAIYVVEDVVETTELAYATSWDQLKAARAACQMYGVY
jgi:hypothetical protein